MSYPSGDGLRSGSTEFKVPQQLCVCRVRNEGHTGQEAGPRSEEGQRKVGETGGPSALLVGTALSPG